MADSTNTYMQKKQAEDAWESNIDWLTDGKSQKTINNLSKQKLQVKKRKYLGMRNY